MTTFQRIPMATFAIVVSAIVAIGWIALEGVVPLVMSMIGGSLIAVRSTLGGDDRQAEQA